MFNQGHRNGTQRLEGKSHHDQTMGPPHGGLTHTFPVRAFWSLGMEILLWSVYQTRFCRVCNQLHVNLCHVQTGVLATSEALEVRVDFLSPAHGCFRKHYSSHFEISESLWLVSRLPFC